MQWLGLFPVLRWGWVAQGDQSASFWAPVSDRKATPRRLQWVLGGTIPGCPAPASSWPGRLPPPNPPPRLTLQHPPPPLVALDPWGGAALAFPALLVLMET